MNFSLWQLPFLTSVQSGLFAFPDGLLPVLVGLLRFRHPCLFRHLSNFGAVNLSEKVDEVVPSLCLSCTDHAGIVIQRMQSPLSELFWTLLLPFLFSFVRSSFYKSVLVPISRFD